MQAFLDDKALIAGAEDSIYYSSGMLLARQLLKRDEQVVDALRMAWKRCLPPGSDRLMYDEYVALTRVLYLALKLQVVTLP